ncbi:MAG TPA: iron ABC transporter permease [Polyangiales bacterium]|nr:iron ABC transporter permease [Polyangiales bacterium]
MPARRALTLLVVASVAALAVNLLAGPTSLQGQELASALLTLRAARGLTAYLVGASLAVAGVLAQGLFRNPLASPDLLGTSAGASFAGKVSILLLSATFGHGSVGGLAVEAWLPIGCLLGALSALLVLLALAKRAPDTVVLLLAGFLLSSLFLGLGSFVTSLAQESWELGRAVIAFALGSVTGAGPRQVATLAPIALIGTLAAFAWARPLDLLLSGEEEARVLGLDVARARRWCIIWIALLTAGAVAVGGNLGFVGLVVPHGLRRVVGVAHRRLVPAAALGGGVFVLACDMVARALPSRTEIPLGVITDLIGAPLFLGLVMRSQRRLLHG